MHSVANYIQKNFPSWRLSIIAPNLCIVACYSSVGWLTSWTIRRHQANMSQITKQDNSVLILAKYPERELIGESFLYGRLNDLFEIIKDVEGINDAILLLALHGLFFFYFFYHSWDNVRDAWLQLEHALTLDKSSYQECSNTLLFGVAVILLVWSVNFKNKKYIINNAHEIMFKRTSLSPFYSGLHCILTCIVRSLLECIWQWLHCPRQYRLVYWSFSSSSLHWHLIFLHKSTKRSVF